MFDHVLTPDEIIRFARNKVRLIGVINLAVKLGDYPCQKIIIFVFKIVDISSNYKVILGRPILTTFRVVASIYHNYLKFQISNIIGVVRGNQSTTRKCNLDIRPRKLKYGG